MNNTSESEKVKVSWAAMCAHIYDEETGKTLAVIPGHRCDEPAPDYAHLMASAPDLLEACKVALDWFKATSDLTGNCLGADVQQRLNEAITKAESL